MFIRYCSIFALFFVSNTVIASQSILYTWVQYIHNDMLSVRAIMADNISSCPSILVDRQTHKMSIRANQSNGFNLVCEFMTDAHAKHIAIAGKSMPVLPQTINQVGIIGDTGCRIRGKDIQNCNSTTAWPLATIAKNMTNNLVIHVGDYIYREDPCPADNDKCAGSAYGYHFDTWQQDWFIPAQPLYESAVMIFTRGNHEDCNRAYEGWFRYLSPYPYDSKQQCTIFEKPFKINLDITKLVVFDDSSSPFGIHQPYIKRNVDSIKKLSLKTTKPLLFITHSPMWAVNIKGDYFGNENHQIAFKDLLPVDSLIISGHVHFGQYVATSNYDQIISGHGGTQLNTIPTTGLVKYGKYKKIIDFVSSVPHFGFVTYDIGTKLITFYTPDKQVITRIIRN